jgi:hypothetical protein
MTVPTEPMQGRVCLTCGQVLNLSTHICAPTQNATGGNYDAPSTAPSLPIEFTGHENRECGEHRTTGLRAWCFDCSEWCYPALPCKGCELPALRAENDQAGEAVMDEGSTQYGFLWGPIEVERMATFAVGKDPSRRNRVIGLYTYVNGERKLRLEICVSPTGRSVRVWRDGEELT